MKLDDIQDKLEIVDMIGVLLIIIGTFLLTVSMVFWFILALVNGV